MRGETGGMRGGISLRWGFLVAGGASAGAPASAKSLAGEGTGDCSAAAGVSDSGRDAGVSGDSGARTGCLLCSGAAATATGVLDSQLTLSAGGDGFSGDGDVFMVTPILPDSLESTSAFRLVPLLSASLCVISGWSSLLLELVSASGGITLLADVVFDADALEVEVDAEGAVVVDADECSHFAVPETSSRLGVLLFSL